MKAQSDIKPDKFELYVYDPEEICVVALRENITLVTPEEEDKSPYYEYDEYSIQTPYLDTLPEVVEEQFDKLLDIARRGEA